MFSVSESFSWGTYFTFPLVPVEFIFDLKLVFLCSHLGRDRADIAAMKKCKKQKDFLLRSNKQELDDILLTEKKKDGNSVKIPQKPLQHRLQRRKGDIIDKRWINLFKGFMQ